jgi:NAD(P)-dependent dehydrogenase (short-subunit alcohol dehydrogenase family)
VLLTLALGIAFRVQEAPPVPVGVVEGEGADALASQLRAARGLEVQRFGESDYDDWLQTLRVNVLGPMKMAEAFADLVAASGQKKLVTLTSMVGSIGQNTFGGLYAYRSSKSAANAVMKCMAIDLRARGIIALPMHPGWVRTEIGGPRGELDTVTSVTGLRKVIAGLTPADAGRFLQWDGRELPW